MLFKGALIFLVFYSLCLVYGTHDPPVSYRIWKGKPIRIEEAPYSIYLEGNRGFRCGGVILNADVVLTAAHCVKYLSQAQVVFRAGSSSKLSGGITVGIRDSLIHPKYDPETWHNDVGLIWLDKMLPFSDKIQPVPQLAVQDEPDPPVGTMAFASGWGLMEDNTYPDILRGVELPIYDWQQCKRLWATSPAHKVVTNRMICAGYMRGKDTCNGDSGAGLVVGGKLVGITAFGTIPCGGQPGVYMKISSYRNWIDFNIANH